MECSGNVYCALVAVTTATEAGVATPSTGAGGGGAGGAGGGELPEGGEPDAGELLPPHPLNTVKIATSIIAARSSRPERTNRKTFDI
jgi:hypothetical protein